jgi:hypothetical protein
MNLYNWDKVYFSNKKHLFKILNFFNYDKTFLFDTLKVWKVKTTFDEIKINFI